MYNVSSATLAAIENFNLQARITGTVNGVAFTDANIVGGSFSINNQCSSDTELTIGNVYVGELNITLTGLSLDRYSLYGKLIIPTYGLYVNNTWVSIPLGEYIISEVEVTNVGIDIRAYDNMSKFDVPFELVSLSGTAYALASAACTACGLTLATTQTQFNTFTNHGVTFTATQTDGKIPQFSTYRDVISAIAQVSCCNVLIDRSGQVVFKPYPSTAVATIDTAHRMMGGMTADFETYYDGIIWTDPATKEQTKYVRSNPSGLTMDLGDNPLINTTAIRTAILNGLTFRFHPFRMNILNAPLYDLMDCIYLPDGVGDGTKLYCISKYTWTYHGSYQIVGTGQDPKLVAVTSSAQRTAQQAAQIAAQKVSSDEMDAAIESATAQITGNNGGNIVWHDSNNDDEPDEILVMNTRSISTATKVWRFNLAGLGFSNSGYSGTYGLALTADGAIVADKVIVGTLGDQAGLNYWNMVTGETKIKALSEYGWNPQEGVLQTYAGEDIQTYDGENIQAYSPATYSLIQTNADGIRLVSENAAHLAAELELVPGKITAAVSALEDSVNASLALEIATDSQNNPYGKISANADYISFSTGDLIINSNQFSLDSSGNATFSGALSAATGSFNGAVTATSLTLGSGVTVPYTKVSGTPDLTVYVAKDGTIGSTPASGVNGFVVTSAGVLKASNAIIYGSLYSSDGTIGGMTLKSNAIYHGTDSMTSTTAGVYLGTGGLRIYGSANNYINATSAGIVTIKGGSITGSTFLSDDGTTQLDNDGLTLRNAATDAASTSKFEIGYKSNTVALRLYTRASTSATWSMLSSIDSNTYGIGIRNARSVESQEYLLRKPTDAAGTGWTFAYLDSNNAANLSSNIGSITNLTASDTVTGRLRISQQIALGSSTATYYSASDLVPLINGRFINAEIVLNPNGGSKTIPIGNATVYKSLIIMGTVGGTGGALIGVAINNGSFTARNLMNNTTWSATGLVISVSGQNLILTNNNTAGSRVTVYAG